MVLVLSLTGTEVSDSASSDAATDSIMADGRPRRVGVDSTGNGGSTIFRVGVE